ncbi:MAG TPA: substrate-binding domain-containing protein [Burkholderiales bacterium]|nr:substrate-binding domain-containing protein [Burkholderiales bacterium]
MLKISIKPQWRLSSEGASQAFPRLLELLAMVEAERSIAAAAAKLGVSYRHAWGLIRQANKEFGAPVLNMTRGRRATLSALGEKLLAADRRIKARITPLLDSLASELEAQIERSHSGPVLRIHASHGYAIELMREFLLRRNQPIELKYRGSMEAIASLAGASCDLAGFHAPLGDLQAAVLAFYAKWLDPRRHVLINLATRRQGIMVAPRNPLAIQSLADLAQPGVRFVNRQFGSGTRILLDLLLKREQLDSGRIAGYDSGEFTHSAVASCISSGLADAGFGVEQGARSFGLEFIPVISERYFLLCDAESLDMPPVGRIRDVLSSKQFRAEAGRLAGIDVTAAGTTLSLIEAFPELQVHCRA